MHPTPHTLSYIIFQYHLITCVWTNTVCIHVDICGGRVWSGLGPGVGDASLGCYEVLVLHSPPVLVPASRPSVHLASDIYPGVPL